MDLNSDSKKPLPKMKIKIISENHATAFEKETEDFLEGKDSYSLQYKPTPNHGGIVIHNVMIVYPEY